MATKNGHGGARAGSGRKSRAEEAGLTELLLETCPITKQRAIMRKLAQDATSDSVAVRQSARVLLLSYLFGKPTERHEVTGAGGDAIDLIATIVIQGVKGDDGE